VGNTESIIKNDVNKHNEFDIRVKFVYSYLLNIKSGLINKNHFCDDFNWNNIDCSNIRKVIEWIACKSALEIYPDNYYIHIEDKTIIRSINEALNKCENDFIREALLNMEKKLNTYVNSL
jgi:hypothetical protein